MYDSGYVSTEDKDIIIEEFKKNEVADRIEAEIMLINVNVTQQASQLAAQSTSEKVKYKCNEILSKANLITEFNEEALKKAKQIEEMLEEIIQMTRNVYARGEEIDADVEDYFDVEGDFDDFL